MDINGYAKMIDPEAFENWKRYQAFRTKDGLSSEQANASADYQYGADIVKARDVAKAIVESVREECAQVCDRWGYQDTAAGEIRSIAALEKAALESAQGGNS